MTVERSASVVVVSGHEEGPVLPSTIQELRASRVELSTGTRLKRGVFGNQVEAQPDVVVNGPVGSTGPVLVQAGRTSSFFGGGIVAGGRCSLSGPIEAGLPVRVTGDVCAREISLEGALVVGNVLGSSIRIASSVVLGHVTSTNETLLSDSIVTSFHSGSLAVQGEVFLLDFSGTVQRTIRIDGSLFTLARSRLRGVAQGDERFVLDALTEEDLEREPSSERGSIGAHRRLLSLPRKDLLRENAALLQRVALPGLSGRLRGLEQRDPVAERLPRKLWQLIRRESAGS
jgi:hypothetical protein